MRLRVIVVLTCFIAACTNLPDNNMQANIMEGKGVLKTFFGDLKTELSAVMKSRWPVAAIGTCKQVVPEIADNLEIS